MRPNAIPAKDYLKNDAEQQGIENSKKRLDGQNRLMIEDLCDFCLKPFYVYRRQMGMRVKGYKFGCFKCHNQGKFKWRTEGGKDKVIPVFQYGKTPKRASNL